MPEITLIPTGNKKNREENPITHAGKARVAAGYTVEQAAALIRVKPETYRTYERGYAPFTCRDALLLSRRFGVDSIDFSQGRNRAAYCKATGRTERKQPRGGKTKT